jgi:hypothetical protein
MVRDLITIVKSLQEEMKKHYLIQQLKPIFILMGSVPEGTKIGLGNETDIMMVFDGFKKPPFQVMEGDPFHLYATEDLPEWMDTYLDSNRRFIFHKFMSDLLHIVSSCIESIFNGKKIIGNLMIKTTNAEFNSDKLKCQDCRKRKDEEHATIFKQCKNCMVAVSQTKIGIGLQFLWRSIVFGKDTVYCSLDLVPTFKIKGIAPLDLARIINMGMIYHKPGGWLKYLQKYAKAEVIMPDILFGSKKDITDKDMIGSVLLKNINTSIDKNYYVRPGQNLNGQKFKSDDLKWVYTRIKALKIIFGVNIDNYMLKKLLWKPNEFVKNRYVPDFVCMRLLYDVMCLPEVRAQFESIIDFRQWERNTKRYRCKIPVLKREEYT